MRPSTRQDWLAAVALLGGLGAAYLIPPATTGHSAARAVAALAISALIALAVSRAPFTFAPRIRTAFVLLVALSVWYVATRAWAIDPAGSMVESSRVSAFVLMAWAAHTTVVGTAARRLLLAGVGACGLFASAHHVKDFVTDGAPTVRVAGELGYWNATAVVALVLVPIAVAIAGSGRRSLQVLAALLIPVAGIAAVATASRGALAALLVALIIQALLDPDYRGGLPRALVAGGSLALVIVGLAIDRVPEVAAVAVPAVLAALAFGMIRRRRDRALDRVVPIKPVDPDAPRRRLPAPAQLVGAVIVVILAGLLIALVYDANNGSVPTQQSDTDVTRLASTDDSRRVDWWKEGIHIWKGAPLVGEGGAAFDATHIDVPGDTVDHVHSMPLEVLIETGLIGVLLLLAAAIQFLRVLRRGRRSVDRALAGSLAALLLTQSLVDWTLSLPQVLALLAVAGPLAFPSPPDPELEPASREVPVPAALGMLASLAAATMIALVPMLASLLGDQAAKQFDAGHPAKAAELSEQSLALVPTLETLNTQVIALQADNRPAAARVTMREHRSVWFTTLPGLQLADEVIGGDRELGPTIDRRIAHIERQRAKHAPPT